MRVLDRPRGMVRTLVAVNTGPKEIILVAYAHEIIVFRLSRTAITQAPALVHSQHISVDDGDVLDMCALGARVLVLTSAGELLVFRAGEERVERVETHVLGPRGLSF